MSDLTLAKVENGRMTYILCGWEKESRISPVSFAMYLIFEYHLWFALNFILNRRSNFSTYLGFKVIVWVQKKSWTYERWDTMQTCSSIVVSFLPGMSAAWRLEYEQSNVLIFFQLSLSQDAVQDSSLPRCRESLIACRK